MDDNSAPLTLLPERKMHWSSFATSFVIQSLAVFLMVLAGLLLPEKLAPISPTVYRVVQLIERPAPQRPAVRPPKPLPVHTVDSPKLVANLLTRPAPQVVRAPQLAPRPEFPRAGLANLLPPIPTKQPQVVHTGAFSTGSQAVPDTRRPAGEVQTGGFGDPNGVKGEGKAGSKLLVASLGSFDLPSGPGSGNGTGGARGVRGTVASVGFGTGVALGNTHRSNANRASIQQSGFGDVRPVSDAPRIRPAAQEIPVVQTPVQITSKPNPVYTEEARQLRIEGEVLLEVAFSATGECHVVRVVRSLGHGLDQAAMRAAQQIRFRPATRNSQPIDSTATVHVVFQLAY